MVILEATSETFDSLIDTEYAVVDCYGDFCAACDILEPVYLAAAGDMSFVRFIQTNLSQNGEIAERFGIMAMPTVLLFRNGQLVDRFEGSVDRAELNEYIAKLLYQ